MKITNKHSIPQAIMNFMNRNEYNAGKSDITISRLIDSPRRSILKKKHWHEIEMDLSAHLPSLMGTALHKMFEEGAEKEKDHISEERIFITVNGWAVSGQIDTQIVGDTILVQDYKSTSAWAVMNEKKDWERQTNLYAYLVEKSKGKIVEAVEIVAFVRDWSRREAERNPDYPQCMVVSIRPPLWSQEERERYLLERLSLHATAETNNLLGEEIGLCTPEEQWKRNPSYAVMKNGNKRATKVFDVEQEANDFIVDKKGFLVITRPAEATRCANFCEAAPFCSQWKEENEIL
jgi:hypothetical protein